jgi:hypothetical protein
MHFYRLADAAESRTSSPGPHTGFWRRRGKEKKLDTSRAIFGSFGEVEKYMKIKLEFSEN